MSEQEIAVLKERIKVLEDALLQNDNTLAITFDCSKSLSNALGLLLSLQVVSPDLLKEKLNLTSDPKATIYRLRERLAKYDVRIHSNRDLGWWLSPEDKTILKEVITAAVMANEPLASR